MSYSSYTDVELLMLLSEGNNSAFTAIYDRYWEQLMTVGINKLNGNITSAEDLVQDIFLNLWQRRETATTIENLSAFLATAMKYKVIDTRLKIAKAKAYETTVKTPAADNTTEEKLSFEELKASPG